SFYHRSAKPTGGYAKRAIFFQEKRRHGNLHWLTLDAGNIFGYTPLSYYLKGYPDARLVTMLNYDACGLGPLDFVICRTELSARAAEVGLPFISANVLDEASGKYLGEPFKIVKLDGFRVAILGLTDPGTPSQVPPELIAGLVFRDPHEVVGEWIPQLKNQADTVVVLSTLSLSDNIALAVAHPEISIIVAGGRMAELRVPLKVDNTLIVEAGQWGEQIGLLKVTYEGDRSAGYRIRYFDEQLVEMGGAWAENSEYLKEIAAHQARLSEQFNVVTGSLGVDMPATKVNSFETNLGNLFADAVRDATGTDVALLDAGGFREGLKSGPVTLGDLYHAYPGEARIIEGTLGGQQLVDLLSQAAGNVGRDGFLQVSGVSFGMYGRKAYSVTVGGLPLKLDAVYTVALTDRMTEGVEGLTGVYEIRDLRMHPYLVSEVVEKYLSSRSGYTNELEERISYFAEPPAEEVMVEPSEEEILTEPGLEEPVQPEESPVVIEEEVYIEEETAPVEEAAPNEYEVIVEEEVDPGLAPAPLEEPAEPEPAIEVEAEPESVLQSVVEGGSIGSTSVEMEGMLYSFSLSEVTVEGTVALEFTLNLRNVGESHKMLSFPTGRSYEFKVYKEDKLLWNYGYNRYFTQDTSSLALAPGEEAAFHAYWDGMTNMKVPLAENLYRFVAEVATTPVQEVSFIALYTPPIV
ncbi:MAG: hypothetical protein A2Y63_01485, partial [Candidatus Riflebacteria bacterium RBG_13_59_9]